MVVTEIVLEPNAVFPRPEPTANCGSPLLH